MTLNDICKNKVVEDIIRNIGWKEKRTDLKDLSQDIYFALLTKDQDFVQSLIDKQEINYYIVRMVLNNICSKTSPYHKTYRKLTQNIDEIPQAELELYKAKYS